MRRLNGTMPLDRYERAAGATLLASELTALNADGKAVRATDTALLTVIGLSKHVEDGHVEVEDGIYALANSADHPVTRAMRGQLCYIEDQNTVAASSVNSIAAGVVVDVYDDEVYVDTRPNARVKGDPGADGADGTDGANGTNGANGADGADGSVPGGIHTADSDEATATTLDIVTGLDAITAFIVQIRRSGALVADDAVVSASGGTITVANGSGYSITNGDKIHWIAAGTTGA